MRRAGNFAASGGLGEGDSSWHQELNLFNIYKSESRDVCRLVHPMICTVKSLGTVTESQADSAKSLQKSVEGPNATNTPG